MGAAAPKPWLFGYRTVIFTVRGFNGFQPEIVMAFRKSVNKRQSAKRFKRDIRKTKAPNVKTAPMRGGIRL